MNAITPCAATSQEVRCVSNSSPASKSTWGGHRPGAGRKPNPQSKPIIVDLTVQRWAVVAFRGQAEFSAAAELTRQGYDVYLPLIAVRRRDPAIASMWHTVRVPLFSGYGFIRISSIESRIPITATPGVREVLLRPDSRPAWLSASVIERLMADDADRCQLAAVVLPSLAVGAAVTIAKGAFADHRAAVLSCDGARTEVSLSLFGRVVSLWLDRAALEVA